MTLEYTPNKTRQVGDNVTVSFSFLFKIFSGKEATDLKVYKIDKSTTPETQGSALTYGVDYTVVLSTTVEGGTVTYTVAPTLTEDAFIIREVDYKQETELKPNNKFNEVAIENSFDKDAMVNSQLLEQTERAIKVSEIYTGSADFTLPPPEASKVLGYDSTGLLMANYSGSDLDTILTTSYGQQLVQSADALGARNVLELGVSNNVQFAQITGSSYVGLPDASTTVKGIAQLKKQIILSNNAGDANNDIDFSAGVFDFDDGSGQALLSALTKRLDATWSEGTNQGGLDTGSKAVDTWYDCYNIYNPTTKVSDALFSVSPSAPTMPSGYTKKKLITSILTDGSGNIVPFTMDGNYIEYKTRRRDQTNVTPTTTKDAYTISTPPRRVRGKFDLIYNGALDGNLFVYNNDDTIITSIIDAYDGTAYLITTFHGDNSKEIRRIVDNSQLFISSPVASNTFYIITLGWKEI